MSHGQVSLFALQVGAVIVSPTRELTRQICEVAKPFVATVPNLTMALLVGGRWVKSVSYYIVLRIFCRMECSLPPMKVPTGDKEPF